MRWFGLFLIAAGVIWIAFSFNSANLAWGNMIPFNTKEINIEREVPMSGVQNLLVDSVSTNVNVIQGSSNQIKVRLSGRISPKYVDTIDLKVAPQGDALKLGVNLPDGMNWGLLNLDMNVELPEKLWKSVKVETKSGDVKLAQTKGDSIDVKSSSGDIQLSQVQAKSATIHAASGNVKMKNVESNQITLQASSGNLVVDDFKSDELAFTAGSGNVKLSGGQSKIKGEASTGDIQLELNSLLQDTDLKAGSGNVTVHMEKEPQSLAVDYRGGSGKGHIQWNGMKYEENAENVIRGSYGSGEVKLKVRISSGDFTLGKG
ncbi:DUF4097 family beta strand repeat-containing protein [Paenibacillus piri]|nr:DUF4097 family beta strand repeat-containing protein [Paenibacillus piri]